MVRSLGIVPSEPGLKVLLKLVRVSHGSVEMIVHKFILEDAVEPLDVGVHLGSSGRTPEMGEFQFLYDRVKQGMEFAAVISVDGVQGERKFSEDRQQKGFGMQAVGRRDQSHPGFPGLQFQGGQSFLE